MTRCLGLLGADLPSTLKTIGTGAFIDLPNLTKLFLRAQTPPKWEYNDVFCFHSGGIGDAYAYTTDNTILYVPEGCVHTYETTVFSNRSLGWTTASGWDYFTHIKSIVDYAPEAYAVYADGTLSFYYDGRIATRQGRVYRLNEGEHFPGWSDTFGGGPTGSSDPEDHSKDITKVVFSPSFRDARPTSTFGWFSDCVNRWQ